MVNTVYLLYITLSTPECLLGALNADSPALALSEIFGAQSCLVPAVRMLSLASREY